jgi:N-acetylglucosamine-6-phosphate deacetylase
MDFPDAVLVPGYIDLHIHGGAGYDVMSADDGGLIAIETHLARHGVTGYLPTTVTAPVDETLWALERLADGIEKSHHRPEEGRAQALGIHLEGPFLSHAKRGVHPPKHLQPPSLELFERFWQAARGHIRILTIAPELTGAGELIAEAARRGICVSLGHSNATYEAARAGVTAGARHVTHTFNAMRPLDHRDPGILAAVLNDPGVCAEIIADGIHVAPAMVELFLRIKGRDGAVLVSDALSATGMGDGRFRLGGFEVNVSGQTCLADGRLAGSVLTLDRAVRNVMNFARWNLADAVRLASINPARQLNELDHRGRLSPGTRADVVVLTPAGEVVRTLVSGNILG